MPARLLGERLSGAELAALIESGVAEGMTIDFKRSVNLEKPVAKTEFAADVASFANAFGGDIVFGMDEDGDGRARELIGLPNFSADKLELQMRQICAANLEPPVPGLRFVPIEFAPGSFALVVRIPRSWSRPHAVLGDTLRFVMRDGNGKRTFKLHELRESFGLSAALADRIQNFRNGRVHDLLLGITPLALTSDSLIVLHVMPLSAFDSPVALDLRPIEAQKDTLGLIGTQGFTTRVNYDGILLCRGEEMERGAYAYAQAFRDGCIESVNAHMLTYGNDNTIMISYERTVVDALNNYMSLLQSLGIEPPIFVALSLLGVRGFGFLVKDCGLEERTTEIDRDQLLLPIAEVATYSESGYEEVLCDSFDRVWQACGRWESAAKRRS